MYYKLKFVLFYIKFLSQLLLLRNFGKFMKNSFQFQLAIATYLARVSLNVITLRGNAHARRRLKDVPVTDAYLVSSGFPYAKVIMLCSFSTG